MSQIPEPTVTVASEIYAALEKSAAAELPREHLGASLIGHNCTRFLWLSFRWAFKNNFPGRTLRLFRRGQIEERAVLGDLEQIGAEVRSLNPETGEQYQASSAMGHFGGSCDGMVRNFPHSGKKWHVLEIKTHNKKSFSDLQKKGVKESKPMHWAQMQVYMALFGLERALYFGVCKDDDHIHTERVYHEPEQSTALLDRASKVIAMPDPPEPLGGPDYYECKMCPAKSLCHEKQWPEVNCRTCAHATPVADKKWHCGIYGEIPDKAAQFAGCPKHAYIPRLLEIPSGWKHIGGDDVSAFYESPSGECVRNGEGAFDVFESKELYNNHDLCILGSPDIKAIRKKFGAKLTG